MEEVAALKQALEQLKIEQSASHTEITEAMVASQQEANQAAVKVFLNALGHHKCCH